MSLTNFSIVTHFPIEVLDSDANGGPATEKHEFIDSQNTLKFFFDGTAPAEIDFDKGFVFAISLGERPMAGFGIKVTSITQDTTGIMSGAVTVSYEETGPHGPTANQITNPYTIVCAKGLHYATNISFHKAAPKLSKLKLKVSGSSSRFIVIARTGYDTSCQILPEDSLYIATYSKVYGPASIGECQAWVAANCHTPDLGSAPVEL